MWTAQICEGCHLQGPGKCDAGAFDNWGKDYKMIANFSPAEGMQTQCVHSDTAWEAMSMCCGVGGPAVLGAKTTAASDQAKKNATISAGVIVPVLVIAMVAYGLYMRKRQKPTWWPSFLRNDRREDTGHAPHREVDLRGRDYI